MEVEMVSALQGVKRSQWRAFLQKSGLKAEEDVESTVLIWDGDMLVAAGSRQGNILKCLAVDPGYQGEGLTGTLLTQLRQDAFQHNLRHLFLYTKPQNQMLFSPLFFYPVAKTGSVLLMENQKDGVRSFVQGLEVPCSEGVIGAAVMNCNPFTRGHRWLIEQAAKECDWMYVFVLSEDRSVFPAEDRLALVRKGTEDLPNVTVHPTGPYLISSATFPTYFLKEQMSPEAVQCELDIAIFSRHYAPHFGINRRYVGSEPLCPVTNRYHEMLEQRLPSAGISLHRLERVEARHAPISASAVRKLLHQGRADELRTLVPDVTFEYLQQNDLI